MLFGTFGFILAWKHQTVENGLQQRHTTLSTCELGYAGQIPAWNKCLYETATLPIWVDLASLAPKAHFGLGPFRLAHCAYTKIRPAEGPQLHWPWEGGATPPQKDPGHVRALKNCE